MPLDTALQTRIIAAFGASRRSLPPVTEVAARSNVRRLASLSRRRRGGAVLNLSTAVVEAGEEAWRVVAPALEGDPESLRRLRNLTRRGTAENRRAREAAVRAAEGPAGRGPAVPRTLPRTPCQGDARQRAYLDRLIGYVRHMSGYDAALPTDIQVRISKAMTSSLGLCSYVGRSRRVTIAERLFRPGIEDILWETVKHELAHLADQVTSTNARSDHGPAWRAWARRLGARPERLCGAADARRIRGAQRRPRGPLEYPPEVKRWLERDRTPGGFRQGELNLEREWISVG